MPRLESLPADILLEIYKHVVDIATHSCTRKKNNEELSSSFSPCKCSSRGPFLKELRALRLTCSALWRFYLENQHTVDRMAAKRLVLGGFEQMRVLVLVDEFRVLTGRASRPVTEQALAELKSRIEDSALPPLLVKNVVLMDHLVGDILHSRGGPDWITWYYDIVRKTELPGVEEEEDSDFTSGWNYDSSSTYDDPADSSTGSTSSMSGGSGEGSMAETMLSQDELPILDVDYPEENLATYSGAEDYSDDDPNYSNFFFPGRRPHPLVLSRVAGMLICRWTIAPEAIGQQHIETFVNDILARYFDRGKYEYASAREHKAFQLLFRYWINVIAESVCEISLGEMQYTDMERGILSWDHAYARFCLERGDVRGLLCSVSVGQFLEKQKEAAEARRVKYWLQLARNTYLPDSP